MSDIVERLRACHGILAGDPECCCEEAANVIERLRKLDSEASEYVESVICMRTHFTGEPPYVGWKGLGLALNEVLDDRKRLREPVKELADDLEEKLRAKKENLL